MLVVRDIDLRVKRLLYDLLPDSGSINASENSVAKNDGACKILVVSVLRRYESVTDSLTGKGEGLTP